MVSLSAKINSVPLGMSQMVSLFLFCLIHFPVFALSGKLVVLRLALSVYVVSAMYPDILVKAAWH